MCSCKGTIMGTELYTFTQTLKNNQFTLLKIKNRLSAT